jgi:cytochrome P450
VKRSLDDFDFGFDEMPGGELHRVLHAFREQGPVAPTRFLGLPAFVISGYDALTSAFKDTRGFPPHRMYQVSFAAQHRLYRKLATPAFRSRAVERYEREDLAKLAHELIDELPDRGEIDLVEGYAARLPYLVITRLLGLPREREEEFHGWALALLRFRDDPAAARRAGKELTRFLAPVVEARRREPCDDVISGLVQARVDGRSLSDEEIYSHVRLLFPTGGETTHGSLGNLFYALFTQGEAWARVCDEPSLASQIVDEALRWETPIAVLPRMSGVQPVVAEGVEIPPDTWVLFAIAGANRDPAVYPDPDRFDVARAPKEALTFGRGVKSCPGMHLARKNMIVALQVLVERMPDLELVDAERALPRRTVLRCPDAIRVRPTRRRGRGDS